jgi:multiple sugar transport system substrate-binding protein
MWGFVNLQITLTLKGENDVAQLKKSSFWMLILILGLSSLLAACSGKEEVTTEQQKEKTEESSNTGNEEVKKEEKIVLDFWTFWGSETRRPIVEKIVEDFNNSQDRIEVKHTFLPWGDVWTKNLASIAAGNPPDVIVNDINTVQFRAEKNQATNLAKYLAAEPEVKDRFYPELWKTVVGADGDAYALPFNTDTRFLFYNKDAFREVGLDPENPPTTWAELEEYAAKLDKKENGRYARIGFYPLWGNFGYDTWLLNGDNGQSYFNYDTGEVTINSPGKVETLKWINEWTDRLGQDTVNAFKAEFGSQQADPFISGKVAMITTTGTFYTQLRDYAKDMDFGVALVPEKEEGAGHWTAGGGFVMEIPYGAKNPDASWEFLKYLTDVDAQKHWAVKNFDNVANIQASEVAATDSELSEQGQEIYDFAVKNMEWTKLNPVPLVAPEYWNFKNPEVDAALLGQKSPEEALEAAQKGVEKLIQDNK